MRWRRNVAIASFAYVTADGSGGRLPAKAPHIKFNYADARNTRPAF